MDVSGFVADPYVETDANLTTDAIIAGSGNKLKQVMLNALAYTKANNPEVDFSDYDLNDDGYIDNIHILSNFDTAKYRTRTGQSPWGVSLWPHKSSISGSSGTVMDPSIKVYSMSAIDHMTDGLTQTHEQGHIFGLDDYYDYKTGGSGLNYVGGADMQSHNMFDWNSYSKLTVGWVSPYVVTGETEITINAASTSGDCIIIPADKDTFNNSAYDEYILIELFSPYGNNVFNYPQDGEYIGNCWNLWSSNFGSLGNYGVRLYHVDSRFGYYGGGSKFIETDSLTGASTHYMLTDNSDYTYDGGYRSYIDSSYYDFKLLSLVQRGKVDTFSGSRTSLNSSDLFRQGDSFTFDDYKQLFTKRNTAITTMDNGEEFPYKITFTAMSKDQVTVKVEVI